MTNITNAACVAANAPGLPDDTRRLIEIEDAIAKIRTQIATADLTRQRTAKPIDPDWFHRARTALRHPMPSGGLALRFDRVDFAAYDLLVLAREGAERDHPPEIVAAAEPPSPT